jgi:hypothetical protein
VDKSVTLGLISRIIARYLAGSIATLGLVDIATSNLLFPDFEGLVTIILGALIGVASEGFMWLARKFGWAR